MSKCREFHNIRSVSNNEKTLSLSLTGFPTYQNSWADKKFKIKTKVYIVFVIYLTPNTILNFICLIKFFFSE